MLEVNFSKVQEAKLESLKDRIQKSITPFDIVVGILYYFSSDFEFTTDYEKLHAAFFQFKDDPLFNSFSFKKGGAYPYSELLENIFTRTTIAGLLTCFNPDFKKYNISIKQQKRIKNNSLKKFSDEEKRRLKEISKEIEINISI